MSGLGSRALARYLAGGRLSRTQAILAKCCECNCDYADGRADCGIPKCPLYQWHPYRGKEAQNGASGSGVER